MICVSRRDASKLVLLLLGAPAGLVAEGCHREQAEGPACTDTTGLTAAERELRAVTLAYVEPSRDPARTCDRCQLFKPGPPAACGGCTVLRGPVSPRGTCKVWAARPA